MRFLKRISFVFLLIFVLFNLNLYAENDYILWKVTKGESTVYLAPTIHCLPEEFYPLNSRVDEILEKSDYLVVELDPSNDKTMKVVRGEGLKYMINKEGKSLRDLLEPEEYTELKNNLSKLGINLNAMSLLNPGTLGQIVLQVILTKEGYSFDLGLDNYYIEKAKTIGKPILELEEALFQLEKLFSLDFTLQLEELRELLTEEGRRENVKAIESFTNYVRTGDLESLEKYFEESVKKNPRLEEYYKSLVDERNLTMTIKIENYLETNGVYFVAIGAGHYIGEYSIRAILEKKGYIIDRVKL